MKFRLNISNPSHIKGILLHLEYVYGYTVEWNKFTDFSNPITIIGNSVCKSVGPSNRGYAMFGIDNTIDDPMYLFAQLKSIDLDGIKKIEDQMKL